MDNSSKRAIDAGIAARMERSWHAFFASFGRLTEVQRSAIPALFEGNDALICSATASGKTEAACAPLVERFLGTGGGWTLLYVSPTRALVNDLYERLEGPASRLGLRLLRRTGEYRPDLTKQHVNILLTTPESLDSLLCRGKINDPSKGHILAQVRAVVLDEIHLLYGTPRGEQVKWLLERLRLIKKQAKKEGWCKEEQIQIVGLSATLADSNRVIQMYFPGGKLISVLGKRDIVPVLPLPKDNMEIHESHSLEMHLPRYIYGLEQPEKILVFCGSRKRVDELTAKFKNLFQEYDYTVIAHHSSIAKALREEAEHITKHNKRVVVFATSTLEIGVDIGDIDVVFLDGPAPDIPAFLQRIGRGNRRSGITRIALCAENLKDMIIQKAMLSSAVDGQLHILPPGPQYAVFRQQIASYLFQAPKRRRHRRQLIGLFKHDIEESKIQNLLEHMVLEGELRETTEGIELGEEWIESSSRGDIHSNLEGTLGYQVIDERTGEKLATDVVLRGGRRITTGGQKLEVTRQYDNTLEVKRFAGEPTSSAGYSYTGSSVKKNDGHASAIRFYLNLPVDLWPIIHNESGILVFHLGGYRRAAVLKLYVDRSGLSREIKVNEYYLHFQNSELINKKWFQNTSVHQLKLDIEKNLQSLENSLGRPNANRSLPTELRLEEVLGWLRLEEEVDALEKSEWRNMDLGILNYFSPNK